MLHVYNIFDFHQPLPAEEEKELKDTLQEILGKGKKVKLEQKVSATCFCLLIITCFDVLLINVLDVDF